MLKMIKFTMCRKYVLGLFFTVNNFLYCETNSFVIPSVDLDSQPTANENQIKPAENQRREDSKLNNESEFSSQLLSSENLNAEIQALSDRGLGRLKTSVSVTK